MLLYSLPLFWFGVPETLPKFAPPVVGSRWLSGMPPSRASHLTVPLTESKTGVPHGSITAAFVQAQSPGAPAPSGRNGTHRLVADAPVQSDALVVVSESGDPLLPSGEANRGTGSGAM